MPGESLKARKARIKSYIDALPFGAQILDERILAVLRCHPEWSTKTNEGHYKVLKNRIGTTLGLKLLTITTDFKTI